MILSPYLAPLVLASVSPRRQEILEGLGLAFEVIPSGIEEPVSAGRSPEENAQELARLKARTVAARVDQGTVIGCDTLVAVENEILGKPASPQDAKRILSLLSGKTQKVISGLCLIHLPTDHELCGHEVTTLFTKPMSKRDIDEYVATGEGLDKAGAYAIQETGDRFIERLEGSFDNVVGFPTELFTRFMDRLLRRIEDGSNG